MGRDMWTSFPIGQERSDFSLTQQPLVADKAEQQVTVDLDVTLVLLLVFLPHVPYLTPSIVIFFSYTFLLFLGTSCLSGWAAQIGLLSSLVISSLTASLRNSDSASTFGGIKKGAPKITWKLFLPKFSLTFLVQLCYQPLTLSSNWIFWIPLSLWSFPFGTALATISFGIIWLKNDRQFVCYSFFSLILSKHLRTREKKIVHLCWGSILYWFRDTHFWSHTAFEWYTSVW